MDGDVEVEYLIADLKNRPNVVQLERILHKIHTLAVTSPALKLNLITTILNTTIPETYSSLPDSVVQLLVPLFANVIGLGNLLNRISLLSSSREVLMLSTFTSFLVQLLRPGFVSQLVQSSRPIEIKEIDKMLFKGRCYAIVQEVSLTSSVDVNGTVFSSPSYYAGYLATEILGLFRNGGVDHKVIIGFINSLIAFNQASFHQFFDIMFTNDNWQYYTYSFHEMRRFEKKTHLTRFLCSFVTDKYLTRNNSNTFSSHKVLALNMLLKPVFDADLIDEILLEKIISAMNYQLNALVSLLISELLEKEYHRILKKSIIYWSNVQLMKSESIAKQEFRTHLVILLLSHCSPQFLKDLLATPEFLSAITNRLDSLSSQVKTLGVIFADMLCEFANIDKIFKMEGINGFDYIRDPKSYVKKSDINISDVHYAWELINEPEVIEIDDEGPGNELAEITNRFASTLTHNEYDSDDDSDMDSDDDDPTIGPKSKVPKPIYIKDILSYLNTNSDNKKAYEFRRLALKFSPTLIRQKANFGNELQFYAEDLLTNFIGLTNTYDDKEFETERLNCIVAVVASAPSSTIKLCQLFAGGDYSLQQRMCLLSAMSLAARELKGLQDEIITQSYNPKLFPTKTLPSHLHYQLIDSTTETFDYGINALESSVQNTLMQEASEDANDKIAGGKILRISRRLTKTAESTSASLTPKIPDFAKVISNNFFFPLISVWYEVGQINIGHYSPILIAHFIKSLVLILHCAYPIASNLNDMIKEYLQLVIPIIRKVSPDQLQIIESIVTGILLICDITDTQYLITNHSQGLKLTQEWLSVIWDSIIDDKLKSLCAGLLLRLNEISEDFERLLLDSMNNLY